MTNQEEILTEDTLIQIMQDIEARLIQQARLVEAAIEDDDTYLAYAYAKEGEELAALGYEYACRLRDLVEPAGEYPGVVEAVEGMLGIENTL